MELILGSQSPRRKQILEFFSVPFRQVPPEVVETVGEEESPASLTTRLAKEKGDHLLERYPSSIILTADTIVSLEGKVYSKPHTSKEGCETLTHLSGRWHEVTTALAMTGKGDQIAASEMTRVLFRPVNAEQIRAYHEQLHCWDKAGAYAIQGAGGLIVEKIEGCFYNVMGVPIQTLSQLLQQVGIDLWQHLKNSSVA